MGQGLSKRRTVLIVEDDLDLPTPHNDAAIRRAIGSY